MNEWTKLKASVAAGWSTCINNAHAQNIRYILLFDDARCLYRHHNSAHFVPKTFSLFTMTKHVAGPPCLHGVSLYLHVLRSFEVSALCVHSCVWPTSSTCHIRSSTLSVTFSLEMIREFAGNLSLKLASKVLPHASEPTSPSGIRCLRHRGSRTCRILCDWCCGMSSCILHCWCCGLSSCTDVDLFLGLHSFLWRLPTALPTFGSSPASVHCVPTAHTSCSCAVHASTGSPSRHVTC